MEIPSSKDLNIRLEQMTNAAPWVIKEWNVYSGEYFLGSIYKREIGRGTPIHTGKKKAIAYQCNIKLFASPSLGMPGDSIPIQEITDLKIAKTQFRKAYYRFIKQLCKVDNQEKLF
jgi:hypothetical protein